MAETLTVLQVLPELGDRRLSDVRHVIPGADPNVGIAYDQQIEADMTGLSFNPNPSGLLGLVTVARGGRALNQWDDSSRLAMMTGSLDVAGLPLRLTIPNSGTSVNTLYRAGLLMRGVELHDMSGIDEDLIRELAMLGIDGEEYSPLGKIKLKFKEDETSEKFHTEYATGLHELGVPFRYNYDSESRENTVTTEWLPVPPKQVALYGSAMMSLDKTNAVQSVQSGVDLLTFGHPFLEAA